MTRKEHLDWARARALEYVESGELIDALSSLVSDILKHEETAAVLENPAMQMLFGRAANDAVEGDGRAVRRFIEGVA